MNSLSFGRAPDGCFLLEARQWLPRRRDVLFPFFADALNLETITPPWLRFQVLNPPPIIVRAGLRIDYRLRLHRIPFRWQSEITCWEPPERFVDEQRRGPYRAWVHEHRFLDRDRGTLVLDSVRYSLFGGALVNALFVQRDVERIFSYRQWKLQELFP